MRHLSLALVLVLVAGVFGGVARADRISAGAVAAEAEAPPGHAGRSAGAARRRVPPTPIPPLRDSELRAALERARPELQACADAEGLRGASVQARVGRDAALRLTIRARPRNPGAELCMDTAVRRHVTPLLARPIVRAARASIRLGRAAVVPPPDGPPPVRPPTDAATRELHDRLDASSGSLRRCLDEAFPGMAGTVTLRVVAHRDGTMALEGASLPPGVPAGPMLVCLQTEVARLHVTTGGERSVTHDLHLGR